MWAGATEHEKTGRANITVPFRTIGPSEQYRTLAAVFKFYQFIHSKYSLSAAPDAVLFYPPTYSASYKLCLEGHMFLHGSFFFFVLNQNLYSAARAK